MSAGLLTQAFVDTVREPGEYYDGDSTRLELVVSADGKRRQYRVRSGLPVSRVEERVGAVSMYSLKRARAKAARIMAELSAGEDPEAIARKRVQAAAGAAFFHSWALGRRSAT